MVGNQGQDFFNGRNLLASERRVEPTACVESADFLQRQVSHFARPIRRSIHSVVVDADQMLVLRSLHVELEAEAKFEAGSEVRQGVLRGVLEQPSVSYDQRDRFLGYGAGVERQEEKCCCGKAAMDGHG
jgi:hypothetical protein